MKFRLVALLLIALSLWQFSGGSTLFPTPLQVFRGYSWDLFAHIIATLNRTAVALSIGTIMGFVVGVAVGESSLANKVIGAPMAFLMPVPGIALAPLGIVLLGFGNRTIIAIGALAAFFPIAYNTAAGLKAVPREPIEAGKLDGAGWGRLLRYVKLPLALPYIVTGFRLSLVRCWRTVIAVEMVAAASCGLGYYIWDSAEYLRMDLVFGGIAVIAGIYLVSTILLRRIDEWKPC